MGRDLKVTVLQTQGVILNIFIHDGLGLRCKSMYMYVTVDHCKTVIGDLGEGTYCRSRNVSGICI